MDEGANQILKAMNDFRLVLSDQQKEAAMQREQGTQQLYAQAQYLNALQQLNTPTLDPARVKAETKGLITDVKPGGVQQSKSDTQLQLQSMRDNAKKSLAEFEASNKDQQAVMKLASDMLNTFGIEGSPSEAATYTRTASDIQKTVKGKMKPVKSTATTLESGKPKFSIKDPKSFFKKGSNITSGNVIDIYGQEQGTIIFNALESLQKQLDNIDDPETREKYRSAYQTQLDEKYPELKKFNFLFK